MQVELSRMPGLDVYADPQMMGVSAWLCRRTGLCKDIQLQCAFTTEASQGYLLTWKSGSKLEDKQHPTSSLATTFAGGNPCKIFAVVLCSLWIESRSSKGPEPYFAMGFGRQSGTKQRIRWPSFSSIFTSTFVNAADQASGTE